jgi:hypothetical protein
MPAAALRGYLEGNDPTTGKRVIDEIVEALTRPVTQEENRYAAVAAPEPGTRQRLLAPDTEDNLQRLFAQRGWTEGLPIILPTEERVAEMLTGTCHAPDKVVRKSYLHDGKQDMRCTVENVAIAAVMAGARPEHLPVLLAIASTGEPATQPSTLPFASAVVVNGPIRNEIGMNSGMGALGPFSPVNAVIGRGWTLLSKLTGWAQRKKTVWSSQGNSYGYTNLCMAENEERSVWEPFHVQKGHKREESVVSLFRGWNVLNSVGAASQESFGDALKLQLQAIPPLYSAATLILDPLVARSLKEIEGFQTPLDVAQWISENYKIPARQFWNYDIIDMLVKPLALHGVKPYADWLTVPDDALITPYNRADKINIIVVGGETSPVWKVADLGFSVSASIDKWRAKATDSIGSDQPAQEGQHAYEAPRS